MRILAEILPRLVAAILICALTYALLKRTRIRTEMLRIFFIGSMASPGAFSLQLSASIGIAGWLQNFGATDYEIELASLALWISVFVGLGSILWPLLEATRKPLGGKT
jgi:hypothetical protein